jgi:hypothetical protein
MESISKKKERTFKVRIFTVLLLLGFIAIPLMSEVSSYNASGWQIAANNGYASQDGAATVAAVVGAGAAVGALCPVQLLVGIGLAY